MNTSLANGWHLGIKVGGKELIFSGFVHIDQSKVDVEFDDMIIEFNFVSEDTGPSRFEAEAEGAQKLIFKLYNHNNSLGEGIFTPLEIGSHEQRKLYVTYFASTINATESRRRLEFAFYLGDAI